MSGGAFNYIDSQLSSEIFGYLDDDKKIPNIFEDKEISELIYDVLNLIHDFDWYASGDTGEDSWLTKKNKFKTKWFTTPPKERIKRIIDDSIIGLKEDLYKTYGITHE